MDSAWISAFSAVMGSLVGGFTSFVTTYANQRHQYRRDFLSKQFAQRETLYSDFINEAARLEVESLDRQMEKASGLVTIYALHNRIRLNASEEVIQGRRAHNRKYYSILQAPQSDSRGNSPGSLFEHRRSSEGIR
jgi:hypothetical protein